MAAAIVTLFLVFVAAIAWVLEIATSRSDKRDKTSAVLQQILKHRVGRSNSTK